MWGSVGGDEERWGSEGKGKGKCGGGVRKYVGLLGSGENVGRGVGSVVVEGKFMG